MAVLPGTGWEIPSGEKYDLSCALFFNYRPHPSDLERLGLETRKDRALHLEEEFPLKLNLFSDPITLRGFVSAVPRDNEGKDTPFPPVEVSGGFPKTPYWVGETELSNGFFLEKVDVRLLSEGFYSRTTAKKGWSDGKKSHSAKYSIPSDLELGEGVVEYRTLALADDPSKKDVGRPTTDRIYSEHSIRARFGKTGKRGYSVAHRYFALEGEREATLRTNVLEYGAKGELLGFYNDGTIVRNGKEVHDARLKYFQSDRNVPLSEVLGKLSRIFSGELEIKQIRELGHARL